MKTVLLTGATGFLGSHLLESLLKNNYEVVVLKRSTSNTWRIDSLLKEVRVYDVDKQPLQKIFEENSIHTVIHMATLYRKADDGVDVQEMITSNVSFPASLIELGVKYGLKAFINTGTFFECDCSVLPVTEQANTKAFNLYAKTKLAFDAILTTYEKELSIVTLRLFSPYGEKDNYKLIPMLVKKALSGLKIELSDGLQKLDFIYSGDVVNANLKVLEKLEANEPLSKVYNIGFGKPLSVRDVVSILEQKLGRRLDVTWGAVSEYDIPCVWSDISRAKKDLGWEPEIDIYQGLEYMLNYYMEESK